ncbi:uncharacterized protein LOC101744095 isoform X3 [Bombyx mori]|uniref:uncharacterized protein LOC101744095 isoform X3 n=1 Tax=Bombyx mori TaxID=7091 RepID=UPI002ED323B5
MYVFVFIAYTYVYKFLLLRVTRHTKGFIFKVLLVASLQAITVNPLCPTNKIAPHRKIASYNQYTGRTFGAFYDLLAPNYSNSNSPFNDLQENPQEDDANDCGEIEDYDENDLSSITQQSQRRQQRHGHRNYFNGFLNRPPHSQPTISSVTTRPQKPMYPSTRPPFFSGGYFGNNPYRPQPIQHPSGGPLNHVVGVSPAKPTRKPTQYDVTSSRTPSYYAYDTESTPTTYYPRLRKNNENNILGSFIDLLFK